MKNRLFYLGLLSIFIVSISFFISVLINTEYYEPVDINPFENNGNKFSIRELKIDTSNLADLTTGFPYEDYLAKVDLNNLIGFSENIKELDSITHDNLTSQFVLSNALTLELEKKIGNIRNLDTLIEILYWADNFRVLSKFDTVNSILFSSVYTHWYQKASE